MDITIPTLNSSAHLEEVINAVVSCIFVDRIIVADGGSTDSTLDILRRYGAEVVPDGGSLGAARDILIHAATSKYFLTLDADVVLQKGDWCLEALSLLESGTDCVVLQMDMVGPLQDFISFYSRFMKRKGLFFATMATFFSKEAIKDIRIPKQLDGSEDLYIMLWLLDHKRKIATLKVPGIHYHSSSPSKGRWVGAGVRNLQKVVGRRKVFPIIFRNIILYPFTLTFAAVCTLNWPLEKYGAGLWIEYVRGYLSGKYTRAMKKDW